MESVRSWSHPGGEGRAFRVRSCSERRKGLGCLLRRVEAALIKLHDVRPSTKSVFLFGQLVNPGLAVAVRE